MSEIIDNVRIFLENPEGAFLFLKRANCKNGEGLWCLPGGKVGRRTPDQACRHETKIETGLTPTIIRYLFEHFEKPKSPGVPSYHTIYYSADYTGVISLNLRESSDAIWIHPDHFGDVDIVFEGDKAVDEMRRRRIKTTLGLDYRV